MKLFSVQGYKLFCTGFSVAVLISSQKLLAQSTAGITHQPDTSYTTYSAWQSTKKTNPEIQIVPEFRFATVAEEKNIVYSTIGKRQLVMDAFYPKERTHTKHAAIIIIHGGGWRSGNRSQHYPLAQKLADMGYVCFTPEYRLSTEALFPAAIYDLKESIRWVKNNAAKYNVDSSRVVIAGFSAGGELATFLGVTGGMPLFEGADGNTGVSTKVNAIIDIDGILSFVHPESGEGDDSKHTSAATYWFGYPKKEQPILWESASSLSYAGANTPPILFINSSVARMHAGREDFINVLNRYPIYSEVHTFETAPHSFPLFYPWFEPMVNEIDVFLKKIFGK